jgi:hypothetical protein
MTGTEADTAPATEPELTNEEYAAIVRELAQQFPAPTWDEVKEDMRWLYDQLYDGTFDPDYKYNGLSIAVYNKRVVGTDVNRLRLRTRLSRELGVHPERIVITSFPEEW